MPRKDIVSYSAKVGYRKHPGMVMWLFHRISGVLIGFFLIFHLLGVAEVSETIGNFVKLKPVISTISVLFVLHAVNGIRILLMEFCSSADRKKFLPHLVATITVIAVVCAFFAFKIAVS